MFSPVALLLATFRMMFSFGLLNTYWSVTVNACLVSLPFTIWMLDGLFLDRAEGDEDGGARRAVGRWRHARPFHPDRHARHRNGADLRLRAAWNEPWLSNFIDLGARLLTTGIFTFVGRTETQWNYLKAASAISVVPVFVGFLLVQRRLVPGWRPVVNRVMWFRWTFLHCLRDPPPAARGGSRSRPAATLILPAK